MKKIVLIAVSFMFIIISGREALPAQNEVDPLERDLIFVEGRAEIDVPVDGFSLTFTFNIDKGSFGDASSESNRIADAVAYNIRSLGLANTQVIKGWDIVKQSMISVGAKGRKISNRIVIKVFDYPQGKLHETIARAIDKGLAVDSAIALEDIKIIVSDNLENKKKEEALSQALKALQSNAVRAAEAVGKNIVTAKRIFITNDQNAYQAESMSYDAMSYKGAPLVRSAVSVQKSFRVESEITDQVKITATVSGVYQIN